MTGWGAHGLDIVQWALGKSDSGPVEVELDDAPPTTVVWVGKETAPTPGMGVLIQPVAMRFADGTRLLLDGKGPGGGAFFEGDDGTILVNRGAYELTRNGKTAAFTEPEGVNDTDSHLTNWIACIRSRELPAADIEIGHRAATLCHLGNIVRWAGERLDWDPVKERFTNNEKANALLEREMRKPWTL